jgi:hypothetical protein
MIDIAQVCHMIRNYHTCATVITALRQPAIARLKKVAFRESSVFFLLFAIGISPILRDDIASTMEAHHLSRGHSSIASTSAFSLAWSA